MRRSYQIRKADEVKHVEARMVITQSLSHHSSDAELISRGMAACPVG